MTQKVLFRLLVTLGLWALLIAGCFLYSFLHPSAAGYVGLGLLVLWYFWIPFLFGLVSLSWFTFQKLAQRQ
jgi:hypothetical protein